METKLAFITHMNEHLKQKVSTGASFTKSSLQRNTKGKGNCNDTLLIVLLQHFINPMPRHQKGKKKNQYEEQKSQTALTLLTLSLHLCSF